jgi:hypothetical protein
VIVSGQRRKRQRRKVEERFGERHVGLEELWLGDELLPGVIVSILGFEVDCDSEGVLFVESVLE